MKFAVAIFTLLSLYFTTSEALIIFVQQVDETVGITQVDGLSMDTTIKELKTKIAIAKGIPLAAFHLLFNNAILHEMETLAACNILDGDTVTVVFKGTLAGILFFGGR